MSYAETIKKELVEMWLLVNSQLTKSCQAIRDFDQDLAREIVLIEERVNCSVYLIDKDCEVFMALSKNQGTDFGFIMPVLKVNRHLERIGDLTADIANEIILTTQPYQKKLIQQTKILAAFSLAIKMQEISLTAFKKEDVELAQLVIKRSKYLDGFHTDIHSILKNNLKDEGGDVSSSVHVLSIARNLEGLVELARELAQDIIGYADLKISKVASMEELGVGT